MGESRIIAPSETHHLGMLKLEVRANEAELLQLSQAGHPAPAPWNLPALAVAVAAGRHIAQLEARIEALEAAQSEAAKEDPMTTARRELELRGGELTDRLSIVAKNLKASSSDSEPMQYEPDPEELERSYKKRVREAMALAEKGAGWDAVIRFAFAGTSTAAPSALCENRRPPTPSELTVIEAWLDRQAKRGEAL